MEEIERKYLVKKLPDNLDEYKKVEITQGYLNHGSEPTLRVRKYNRDYFLTYKYSNDEQKKNKCNVCTEYELPISKKAFDHLNTKIDGRIIHKNRYLIPNKDGLTIELDVFLDWLEGLIIAEDEFPNDKVFETFKKPNWLGEDVSKEEKYRNSYIASGDVNIEDLLL